VAVVGASGVGKSTLLHVLGLLDTPDRGEVICSGVDLSALPPDLRALWRNRMFGFVFQFYHLVPELSALENTILPAMMHGRPGEPSPNRRVLRDRATGILTELGLQDRLKHRPAQLSGGERQRVAIARALMNEPAIVLCDEPTGNLDPATSVGVQDALWALRERRGQTMLLVTHDEELAARADRILRMENGRLTEVSSREEPIAAPAAEEIRPAAVKRMPLPQSLLSLEGRLGRAGYWLTGIFPTVLLGLAGWAIYRYGNGGKAGLLGALAWFTLNLFLLWPLIATGAKRCHDRNRSGKFLLLVFVPGAILGVLAFLVTTLELSALFWLIGVPPALFLLWALVEIWCLKGTEGPNRYGADPVRPIYGFRPV
jgi:lipoprotein-releasing system ATP-binding protein